MTEGTAWLVVLGWWGVAGATLYWAHRRRVRRGSFSRRRSETHDVMVLAVSEWLEEPTIRRAAVRSGIPEQRLQAFYRAAGQLEEPMFEACVSRLLQSREVRQAVAKYTAQVYHADRQQAMRSLMRWAELGRGDAGGGGRTAADDSGDPAAGSGGAAAEGAVDLDRVLRRAAGVAPDGR